MLKIGILYKKYFSKDRNKENIVDLTRTSINATVLANTAAINTYMVKQEHQMRADLVAKTLYGDQNKADLLMKYNAISNPFSIAEGDILFIPTMENLDSLVKMPVPIEDIGDTSGIVDESEVFTNPKDNKDKERLKQLKEKNKGKDILPSNLNKKGNKNIKIKNGKVVFGEDVTSVNKKDCPEPISRANLKKALIKNNLFG
jgi:hypothetical protein